MRRLVVLVVPVVIVLGACSSAKHASTPTTGPTSGSRPSTSTTAVTPATTTTVATTTTRAATTTTTAACAVSGTTLAKSTPAKQPAALLTNFAISDGPCSAGVYFTFRTHGTAVPSCTVAYSTGPFTEVASGKPVAVAGNAFVAVRCAPAYGYDFETGTPTYTGPKHLTEPSPTGYVREVVETGDSEGVVNWVIGLDRERPFTITATGAPVRQLIATFR